MWTPEAAAHMPADVGDPAQAPMYGGEVPARSVFSRYLGGGNFGILTLLATKSHRVWLSEISCARFRYGPSFPHAARIVLAS
jgi:hypothetical protein